jgi:uncharacterized protein (TIGR00369 family)
MAINGQLMELLGSYDQLRHEIAANHVRSARNGFVHGTATFLHRGRTTHVLEIRVVDDAGKLISFVKMTNAIVPREHKEHS